MDAISFILGVMVFGGFIIMSGVGTMAFIEIISDYLEKKRYKHYAVLSLLFGTMPLFALAGLLAYLNK